MQRFWQSPRIARKPGYKAVDLFEAVRTGKVRALWVIGTNPAISLPDSLRVREALANCEFLVVSEMTPETDTARYADLLLPAAGWGERSGTVTNSERCISRQRGFLDAPGEARPDWWALAELGKRLGYVDAFDYDGPADVFREHAALSAFENTQRAFNLGGLAELSDEEFEALAPTRWPIPTKGAPGTDRLFTDGHFSTPNGRARNNFV